MVPRRSSTFVRGGSHGEVTGIMTGMTDRGLPIVDGAPACPFVAFDDDRDARATSPDHRHRCYAEIRPAPRALAHQEAYCLSSSFAVCPTFQDWARREAAKATAAAQAVSPVVVPGADTGPGATDRSISQPPSSSNPPRNPPRDWSAPPPWLGAERDGDQDADDEREVGPRPAPGGGLSGSFADRLTSSPASSSSAAQAPVWQDQPPGSITEPTPTYLATPRIEEADDADEDAALVARPATRRPAGQRSRERSQTTDQLGPVWERPRRREAYPTLRSRMGLGGVTVPSVLIGVAAVLIAAVALFFLPAFLGIGNPHPSASPTASAGASGSVPTATPGTPTEVPVATPQTYVVQAGDTMSKIAKRFGVPLQALVDANKATVPNPDKVVIGQQVIIPVVAPTSLPGVGASPSP